MSNDAMASAITSAAKASFGAQVVTKTLDTLNKTAPMCASLSGDMNATYETSKAVLSAAFATKGAIAAIKS